jgi:hypothetical protein
LFLASQQGGLQLITHALGLAQFLLLQGRFQVVGGDQGLELGGMTAG